VVVEQAGGSNPKAAAAFPKGSISLLGGPAQAEESCSQIVSRPWWRCSKRSSH
jgi:hypothetical protein